MIILIMLTIIAVYFLSVNFFIAMAKKHQLTSITMMIIGLTPVLNLIVAFVLFIFNEETSKKFFE